MGIKQWSDGAMEYRKFNAQHSKTPLLQFQVNCENKGFIKQRHGHE